MDIEAITFIPINEHFCTRSCFSRMFSDEGLGEGCKSNKIGVRAQGIKRCFF